MPSSAGWSWPRSETGPRYAAALAPAVAQASAIPDFAISKTGEYIETLDIAEMVERSLVVVAKLRNATKEELARIRGMVQQPMFQQAIQEAMSKYWNTWVGGWIGWDVPPGKSVEGDIEVPFAGAKIPSKMTRTHLGAAKGKKGDVRLQKVGVATGPKVRQQMILAMKNMFGATAPQGGFEREIGEVVMKTAVWVETRLSDLRPSAACIMGLSVESGRSPGLRLADGPTS